MADWQDWREAESRSVPLKRFLLLSALAWAGLVLEPVLFSDDGSARSAQSRLLGWFAVLIVMLLVTGILWVRWFHVVAKRVERTGRPRFRGPWWFWAWVIPGASMVLPKMMVNDVWHAADAPGRPEPVPPVVQAWWVMWVIGATPNVFRPSRLPGGLGFVVFAVMLTCQVVSAVLAIRVVDTLNGRLRDLDERVPEAFVYADA